eukprot:scaffold130629_cov22-Tisochrysis_lutea.AAC.1
MLNEHLILGAVILNEAHEHKDLTQPGCGPICKGSSLQLSLSVPAACIPNIFCFFQKFCQARYATSLTVCITEGTTSACEDAMNTAYSGMAPFTCIKKASDDECLKAIKRKEADLTVVGGECVSCLGAVR